MMWYLTAVHSLFSLNMCKKKKLSPFLLYLLDRVGNILFSVETQTTEERTQLYHAEIDALYKDLTAKGKILVLSAELGVSLF